MMDIGPDSFEPLIPKIHRKMPVEVMRDFDTVLLFGELSAVSQTDLTVRRALDEARFPVIKENSAVLVRCYDIQINPVILRARVVRSSETECMMGELKPIPYRTCRKHVRYPLCPPAEISVSNGSVLEQLQPCQLLNINADGACIVTKCLYTVGQTLRLTGQLPKAEESISCPCRVLRTTPRSDGCFEHGLLFMHLNENQRSQLTNALYSRFWSCFAGQDDSPEE